MKSAPFIFGGLLFLTCAAFFWPFCFYSYSICVKCGASRRTREWQLPRSQSSFFSHSSVTGTPLSLYLSSTVVPKHAHLWLFGHGGGNGVRCALGDGDALRSSVSSSNVVAFLECTRRYGQSNEFAKFLTLTFDRDQSRGVLSLAVLMPTNGFSSQEAYRAWILEQSPWMEVIFDPGKLK